MINREIILNYYEILYHENDENINKKTKLNEKKKKYDFNRVISII